ncbi:hypothetical protein QSU92_11705 [Microbacterium sp. ET2]|uniref:hypothetical protein n=1 Tax=Microbacterium albipurpureum TaxID=3050384 RepID=UPI00259C6976|nr:hypothetical protein [Microbacterium sp. ET2 (Ac-2212)]WJL94632.1 hypothetical protein QSU92_11705 [Microbacterium sp. ET2 (Ac-2212)]
MNNTNRVLNRIVLFVVGLVLVALGAVAIAATAWNPARDAWSSATQAGDSWLAGAAEATAIGATTASWVAVGAVVLIVLAIALLIFLLTRVGGGRSRVVMRSDSSETPLGRVVVREGFASDALKNALSTRPDVLSVSVSASDIRRQPVMHVAVTPRQNTDPRSLAEDVDQLVANLAIMTGRQIPTYISVHSGLRARLASDHRRLA